VRPVHAVQCNNAAGEPAALRNSSQINKPQLALLAGLVGGSIASDVALIVVAIIALIFEVRTVGHGVDDPTEVTLMEAAVAVTLVQFTDCIGDVIQFGNNRMLNFAQTDNQADDEQRRDKDEFGADDETRFVIQEL
jgi:hypothetical protein